MSILKGQDLIIFTTDDSGTTYDVLARASSCELSISREQLDITSKSSGDYKESISGRIEWNISTGGLIDFTETNGYVTIDEALLNGTALEVAIGIASKNANTTPNTLDITTAGNVYYTGTVNVTSVSVNTGNAGELATYSASFEGTGQLVRTVVTV